MPVRTAARRVGVVGIGASAGGLETFETFLAHVPPASGLAYVLVQHLDPSHPSHLGELLQRRTRMPVHEAQDCMVVLADTVYVIPPNHDMTLVRGTLRLTAPAGLRGLHMPIDTFLHSLADDLGEQAMAVILSGNGTDGSLGLRSVLAAGGIGLVQDPATARFDGMPARAMRTCKATAVLPVERMAALLASAGDASTRQRHGATTSAAGIERVLVQLQQAIGHDFSQYKKTTVGRRIARRMAQHMVQSFDAYSRYLHDHPAEAQLLLDDLLINVTGFFRDPEAFEVLRLKVLPELCRAKARGDVFRAWVAGGSTGEEALSLAMLLREHMDETRCELKVQLYSTDLDADAIVVARAGHYPAHIASDLRPDRLQRFFTRDDGGYRIRKDIRDMVVFAVQNVIKDPPFTRLDLLCCRNLMIYLEAPLQNRLLPVFHYALRPGGMLFLSPSESIGAHGELFGTVSRRWKLYRASAAAPDGRFRMSPALRRTSPQVPKPTEEPMPPDPDINYLELARRALLQTYAPASVVTDLSGQILFVHGDTGPYLRPAPGQPTLNVVDMAREALQLPLRRALHDIVRGSTAGLPAADAATPSQPGFSLRLLGDSGADKGLLLISFFPAEAAPPRRPARRAAARKPGAPPDSRVAELEHALSSTRENLQAALEEAQASNEELKSANEEMQSTNEELQSSNEELETSREELQSVNEELVTVNAELQLRIEQLAGMQNDMKNLLDNISIGTIFLDENLLIRRFTKEALRAYRLVPSDVGRPLADIKCNLLDVDLVADARAVVDTLLPGERELKSSAGNTYLARMQPYRTLDNVIEGVVLTFTDISLRVEADRAAEQASELAACVVNTVREPLLVLDGALRVVSASRSFYRDFNMREADTVGALVYELGAGEWNLPRLRELLDTVLPRNQSFEDHAVDRVLPDGTRQRLLLNARRVVGKRGPMPLILLAIDAGHAGDPGAGGA